MNMNMYVPIRDTKWPAYSKYIHSTKCNASKMSNEEAYNSVISRLNVIRRDSFEIDITAADFYNRYFWVVFKIIAFTCAQVSSLTSLDRLCRLAYLQSIDIKPI